MWAYCCGVHIDMNYITTISAAKEAVRKLEMADVWFVDTEGTSLDPYRNNLLLLQINDGKNVYVFDFVQLPLDTLQLFIRGFMSVSITKVFQNAKYDIKVLYHATKGKCLPNCVHDTLVTEQVLWAGLNPGGFGLDDIVKRRLDLVLDKEIRNTFQTHEGMFTPEQLEYAARDVEVLPLIYQQQLVDIQEKKLQRVYTDEMLLVPVVALMEYTGMPFNPAYMAELVPVFEHAIKVAAQALQDIFIRAGVVDTIVFTEEGYYGINLNSRDQMLAAFNAVGVNVPDLGAKTLLTWDFKNKKRQKNYELDFSDYVDDDELSVIIGNFGTIENDYLRAYGYYVAINKLYSTYVVGLPQIVNPVTQRIHSNFNQARARTGRFGSSKPNLQNLAKDKKLEQLGINGSIRQAFQCMSPTRRLIIADYAAIELVIIADASGDQKLIDAVIQDFVHEYVTQEVLGWTGITKENKKQKPHVYYREGAKRISYSIAYGVGGDSLAEQITLDLAPIGVKFTKADGERFIHHWKEIFPNAGAWLDKNAKSVVEYGYVTDGIGRKRFWDTSQFSNKWKRAAAQREASNFPVQSLSAHMTKLALINTHNMLDLSKARLVSTVHDEILVESTLSYAEEAAFILKTGMETAAKAVLKHLGDLVIVTPAISTKYDK